MKRVVVMDSADWLFGDIPAPVNEQTSQTKKADLVPTNPSNKKTKVGFSSKETARDEELLGLSASQVANILCEIFATKGKLRLENLGRCFCDNVIVTHLYAADDSSVFIRGGSHLVGAFSAAPPSRAEADRRVFIEVDSDPALAAATPSLSLDFYLGNRCPGFNNLRPILSAKGSQEEEASDVVAVVYRVRHDKIDSVWVSERDKVSEVQQAMTAMRLGGAKALISTEIWRRVKLLIREHGVLGSKYCGLKYHYSDYSTCSDSLGMGLGFVCTTETWEEAGDPEAAAEAEATKANQAFERVTGHLGNDSKLAKACKVLAAMLQTSLMPATRRAAFLAVRAAMGRGGARASAEATRGLMMEVMAAAEARRGELESLGGRAKEMVRWWFMHTRNTVGLTGDDTFAFAKSAKLVQEELEKLGEKGERYEDGYIRKAAAAAGPALLDGEIAAEEPGECRAQALLDSLKKLLLSHGAVSNGTKDMEVVLRSCNLSSRVTSFTVFAAHAKLGNAAELRIDANGMETFVGRSFFQRAILRQMMVRRYGFAWAKSPVDMVFRVLVDPAIRETFGLLRTQVEEQQDALARKRKAEVEKQGALEYQTAGFQHGKKGW